MPLRHRHAQKGGMRARQDLDRIVRKVERMWEPGRVREGWLMVYTFWRTSSGCRGGRWQSGRKEKQMEEERGWKPRRRKEEQKEEM